MSVLRLLRQYRIVTVLILIYACTLGWKVNEWYTGIETPTAEQVAYALGALGLVFGVAKAWTTTKANDGGNT